MVLSVDVYRVVCNRMMKQLQTSVVAEDQNVDTAWQVGNECAVYVNADSCWYRGIVSDIATDNHKVCEKFHQIDTKTILITF